MIQVESGFLGCWVWAGGEGDGTGHRLPNHIVTWKDVQRYLVDQYERNHVAGRYIISINPYSVVNRNLLNRMTSQWSLYSDGHLEGPNIFTRAFGVILCNIFLQSA